MRVLYDHQAFSLQDTGGITRYYYEIASRLSLRPETGLTLLLGFSDTIWPVDTLTPKCRLVHWGRRPIASRLGTYALNELLLSATAMLQNKVDIYHSTLYRFMPAVRAKRFVATHHDCIQERFPELFPDHGRIIRAKRRMFKKADLVFCVSESSRADLERFYGVEPSRCRVVYNGVTPMLRPAKGSALLPATLDKPFLLYVGSRAPYKNFDTLLEVFAATRLEQNYNLAVFGGGPFSPDEQKLIEKLNLRDAITAVPLASPDMLAEAYYSANLLIYPSRYEGFGLPPLEAMHAETPALVAASPATLEVCGDAVFFFDPSDQEDFARQLQNALENTEARRTKVAKGKVLVSKYNWANTAQEVLEGYQSLL